MTTSASGNEGRKLWLLLVICAVFLTFFHPLLAFNVRNIVDDLCYVKWLHRLVLFEDPQCPNPYHFPGVAFVWLPAGIIGRGFAWLLGISPRATILIFVGLTSFLCWAGALFFVDKIVRFYGRKHLDSVAWTLLFALSVPVLHFGTARNTMNHSAEFLLAAAAVYFALREKFVLSLFLGFWLSATRLNDAPILFVTLARFVDVRWGKTKKISAKDLKWFVGMGLLTLLLAYPFLKVTFITSYGGDSIREYLRAINWKETRRTLIGDQIGLIFSSPWWLLIFGLSVAHFRRLTWMSRAAVAWLVAEILVTIGNEGNGNSFGYRYLIGTYLVVLVLWLEMAPFLSRRVLQISKVFLAWSALWYTHLAWVYDHFSSFWEVFAREIVQRGDWALAVRQMVHPVMRFQFSPLGIVIRSFVAPSGMVGPFQERLETAALWANALLTVTALGLLLWTVGRLFRKSGPPIPPPA